VARNTWHSSLFLNPDSTPRRGPSACPWAAGHADRLLLQRCRDKRAALRLMSTLLKKQSRCWTSQPTPGPVCAPAGVPAVLGKRLARRALPVPGIKMSKHHAVGVPLLQLNGVRQPGCDFR
jgi:hypothetical protein